MWLDNRFSLLHRQSRKDPGTLERVNRVVLNTLPPTFKSIQSNLHFLCAECTGDAFGEGWPLNFNCSIAPVIVIRFESLRPLDKISEAERPSVSVKIEWLLDDDEVLSIDKSFKWVGTSDWFSNRHCVFDESSWLKCMSLDCAAVWFGCNARLSEPSWLTVEQFPQQFTAGSAMRDPFCEPTQTSIIPLVLGLSLGCIQCLAESVLLQSRLSLCSPLTTIDDCKEYCATYPSSRTLTTGGPWLTAPLFRRGSSTSRTGWWTLIHPETFSKTLKIIRESGGDPLLETDEGQRTIKGQPSQTIPDWTNLVYYCCL